MVFATALLSLCLISQIGSVKVVIDGTIDFGPHWNLEYKLKTTRDTEPRKRVSDNTGIILKNGDVDTKVREEGIDAVTTKIINDKDENDERDRAELVAIDDSSDGKSREERTYGVTRLYKTNIRTGEMLRNPRKIKYDAKLIKFAERIKNQSLKMFDSLREKFNDKAILEKVPGLKDRYANKFGGFVKETNDHTIRTMFGDKKVVLNVIDYSNKLLKRLVNRFKIDLEDSGLRSSSGISQTFEKHIDNLNIAAYEDACRIFSICRAGNEFSDHINELITKLLESNDLKVQLTVKAVVKSLKTANFNKIMDTETQQAFKSGLESIEELNPFDFRVLLMAYKIIIESRHQPIQNKDPDDPLPKVIVAMYDVMEGFNEKIIIGSKDWQKIKKDFSRWLDGDEKNVTDIANELVDRVKNKIEALDDTTANDFEAKLRMCLLAKTTRSDISSFIQFQPFVV